MARPEPLPDPKALIACQQAMLMRLAEIGMEIAEACGRLAVGGTDGDKADAALGYSRAARAVRMTLALQSRLAKDAEALNGAETAARADKVRRRREHIHREVEKTAEPADWTEALDVSRAIWERLADEDETTLLDRPVAEVVALICKDLGLAPDWGVEAFDSATPPHPQKQPSSSALCRGSRGPPQGRWEMGSDREAEAGILGTRPRMTTEQPTPTPPPPKPPSQPPLARASSLPP